MKHCLGISSLESGTLEYDSKKYSNKNIVREGQTKNKSYKKIIIDLKKNF